MKTSTILLAAMIASTLPSLRTAEAAEIASAYSDLDFDRCDVLSEDTAGVVLKCAGYDGLPIYVKEGDQRHSLFYGKVDPALIAEAFESFSAFNQVNTRIEWRLDQEGTPFAAILRWFVDNPGADGDPTKAPSGEVLVVSRVARDGDDASCFVAMIDAKSNSGANELARRAADEAAKDFACGYQEPEWIGKRGPLASDVTAWWPEGYVVE